MPERADNQRTTVDRRNGPDFRFSGTGGGNADARQLIAQVASVAGRWWLPWWPLGNVHRTPSQSSLEHMSR
jgi:hypothetical protein